MMVGIILWRRSVALVAWSRRWNIALWQGTKKQSLACTVRHQNLSSFTRLRDKTYNKKQ
ncbi:hypothetical protein Bca4012_096565 [Brassica carinata]